MAKQQIVLTAQAGDFFVLRISPSMLVGGTSQMALEKWFLEGLCASRSTAIFSVTRTPDEVSIVCSRQFIQSFPLEPMSSEIQLEGDWRSFKVEGPLDFGMIGVMAGLSGCLAARQISILAVSTFDTDYLLVKDDKFARAKQALQLAGYHVRTVRPHKAATASL